MHRRTVRLIASVTMIIALAGACGSDSPVADLRPGTTVDGGAAPAPTDAPAATDAPAVPAPTDAPVATDAPVTTDVPVTPDPNPTDPDPDDGVDLVAVLLIIGGVLLAAVVIGSLIARSKKPSGTTAPAAAPPSAQSSLLSTSQWITDQLSLELMAAPPAQAQQRWSIERSRLDNVAIGAQQQYLEAQDANWQPLAQTMSALAAAIDTNLQLRAQDPPSAQLINESVEVVNRHRLGVQQLVVALRPTIDR